MGSKGGFNKLSKSAQRIPQKHYPEAPEQKTNWAKILKLIIKILEPELRKMPKQYVIVPIAFIAFEVWGITEFVLLIIELFRSYSFTN